MPRRVQIDKYTEKVIGTKPCFDRIIFKGYLPISWAESMEGFMNHQGVLLKDFKRFVTVHSERIKQHARAMAENSGRPYVHLNGEVHKEEKARKIADSDGITQGLVSILAPMEACQSFKLDFRNERPDIAFGSRESDGL